MRQQALTMDLAQRLAAVALGHIGLEWPNKLDHVLGGPEDLRSPRELHPTFFGSFDWHSCVHAHWMLARLLRRLLEMPAAPAIRALFDERFTPTKIAAERAYLDRPLSRGFERPLWLGVAAGAGGGAGRAGRRPLGCRAAAAQKAFAARLREWLPRADYPVRAGTHGNTGFALALSAEWTAACDPELLPLLQVKALDWYGEDADCQAWEPGGDDFLSPALIEAECMRRLLPPGRFATWLDRFLPRLAEGTPATLFCPVRVSDRTDGRIVHLDGVNLSRAWCWRTLARTWPGTNPRRVMAETAAAEHLAASLPHIAGDYMGEHWLASFAVLALEA